MHHWNWHTHTQYIYNIYIEPPTTTQQHLTGHRDYIVAQLGFTTPGEAIPISMYTKKEMLLFLDAVIYSFFSLLEYWLYGTRITNTWILCAILLQNHHSVSVLHIAFSHDFVANHVCMHVVVCFFHFQWKVASFSTRKCQNDTKYRLSPEFYGLFSALFYAFHNSDTFIVDFILSIKHQSHSNQTSRMPLEIFWELNEIFFFQSVFLFFFLTQSGINKPSRKSFRVYWLTLWRIFFLHISTKILSEKCVFKISEKSQQITPGKELLPENHTQCIVIVSTPTATTRNVCRKEIDVLLGTSWKLGAFYIYQFTWKQHTQA